MKKAVILPAHQPSLSYSGARLQLQQLLCRAAAEAAAGCMLCADQNLMYSARWWRSAPPSQACVVPCSLTCCMLPCFSSVWEHHCSPYSRVYGLDSTWRGITGCPEAHAAPIHACLPLCFRAL